MWEQIIDAIILSKPNKTLGIENNCSKIEFKKYAEKMVLAILKQTRKVECNLIIEKARKKRMVRSMG